MCVTNSGAHSDDGVAQTITLHDTVDTLTFKDSVRSVAVNENNNGLASSTTTCARIDNSTTNNTPTNKLTLTMFPPVLKNDDLTPISPQLVPESTIEIMCDLPESYADCYERLRLLYNSTSCNGGKPGSCGTTCMTAADSLDTNLVVAKGFHLPEENFTCPQDAARSLAGDNSLTEPVTNQLEMLNFSGHGMLRGGAEDVILGFILEGNGIADVILHADIIDTGVTPRLNLNKIFINETGQFYGYLLDQQQNPKSFTFDKAVAAGAYTIQMTSIGEKGRGMAGITLKNSSLNLINLSVRGYLQQPLVFNFVVNGEGTQQAKISSSILEGEVETQMTLINLATGQAISGDAGLANGTTVDIAAGSYAIILDVVSGQGIGMIQVDLVQ